MSAPAFPPQPPPLQKAKTIDEVVRNLDQIIAWSISAQSAIGYFAVLYKRSTLAVRAAIKDNKFDDSKRMERFDVVFANRYFSALNAYSYPGKYGGLSMPWEVSFVGHESTQATMIQQMMTGLNAHICFDLGVAAAEIAPDSLDELEHDFNLINALVATQIPGMLDVAQELSPSLRRVRRVLPNMSQVWLIRRLLVEFRDGAWLFAIHLAKHPAQAKERTVKQAAWTAALGAWYLDPPRRWTLFPQMVREIAKHESRDVARNLKALAAVMNKPDDRPGKYL